MYTGLSPTTRYWHALPKMKVETVFVNISGFFGKLSTKLNVVQIKCHFVPLCCVMSAVVICVLLIALICSLVYEVFQNADMVHIS